MSVSTLKSHIWCETVSLCAISSIILLKYQVVAKEILNYNGCDWKTSFLLLHFQTYEIVTFYSIKMNNKNFISALAILNLLIPSIHIMMTKKNCSSVRYLIWARKNCLVSLILKLSIDLILAFHRKLFGSTDLSGLISSAFKDITKIPYNSQLFDYWISEISDDIADWSLCFTWDSRMIVVFADTLSLAPRKNQTSSRLLRRWLTLLSHCRTTIPPQIYHSSKYNFYYLQ